MKKLQGIVLIDKDDTLCDARTDTLTDDRINGLIAACQAAGFLVGLNSDSPNAALETTATTVGALGPIIAERGAVVADSPGDTPHVIITTERAERLVTVRTVLGQRLSAEGTLVLAGDVVKLRRCGLPTRWPVGCGVVGLNTLRLASLMCFTWTAQSTGALEPDADRLAAVSDLLVSLRLDTSRHYQQIRNTKYGVLVVHSTEANKEAGVRWVRERLGHVPIAMIGDSMHDECGPDVVHVAVGNADTAFRLRADVHMSGTYTTGVCEYLQQILDRGVLA